VLNNRFIILTVDVEDWFQVENFKTWIPFSSWDRRELRVERNTHRLLDLLDGAWEKGYRVQGTGSKGGLEDNGQRTTDNGAGGTPRATFFILGWLAERLPHLVREIHARGHEVASHGYEHRLGTDLSIRDLRNDLEDSKKRLEDITGEAVKGYRAPSFCINHETLRAIADSGYLYDSSYNSFSLHSRYGRLDLSQNGRKGIAYEVRVQGEGLRAGAPRSGVPEYWSDGDLDLLAKAKKGTDKMNGAQGRYRTTRTPEGPERVKRAKQSSAIEQPERIQPLNPTKRPEPSIRPFYELPVSNLQVGRHILPWGGGAYFRLIPRAVYRLGVESILKKLSAHVLYIHPWELDPNQPRVRQASVNFRFRHYTNLKKTEEKLQSFMNAFRECRFVSCSEYIEIINKERRSNQSTRTSQRRNP
jgi:hypothetical protein